MELTTARRGTFVTMNYLSPTTVEMLSRELSRCRGLQLIMESMISINHGRVEHEERIEEPHQGEDPHPPDYVGAVTTTTFVTMNYLSPKPSKD